MHMRFLIPLLVFLLLAGSAFGSVKTTTYVEYVEIWENYYGGRIYWNFSGEQAKSVRDALKSHYDFNHDGNLEMNEAVDYVKNIAKLLVGQKIGTVMVKNAGDVKPLHDWYSGGESMDEGDIKGLLGSLNSSSSFVIKLRFSANPVSDGNLNSLNLSKVPIVAALNTTLENYTIPKEFVQREHTEIGLTFSSYEKTEGALVLRLVFGSFYYYSGSVPNDENIKTVDFSFWDSPLILFIILLVSARVANVMERRNYDRNVDKGSTFSRRKKVGTLNLVLKILLVILYLFAAFFVFYLSGLMFLIICVAYVATIAVVSHKLYSSKIPTVKKGIVMVEDVFLLSKSGIMISHETRRLKPEVDEDVLSGMLVAIQEFVRESFKDEGEIELKKIEFGDKKIFLHRGKYLILAAVMRGELDSFVEHRLKTTLEEIEKKYADILPNWKGDVEKFRGVRDMLRKIWE